MANVTSTASAHSTLNDPTRDIAHDISSSSELRFPTSTTESGHRVSSWLHRGDPVAMSAPSETHSDTQSNLGDSTYEFIDTDEESRDGNATESVASTDHGPFDDAASVASLADTLQSDDENESEQAHNTSGIPSFAALDESTVTPTVGQSVAVFLDDVDRSLTHSIEFDEPESQFGTDTVQVKHTIADFDEEQSARLFAFGPSGKAPQRMTATIRQTMTKQGLSTREPLRILYVGSHSAKQDIIHKIASSVAASIENGVHVGEGPHRSSQIFNVVPVSAFGSMRTPEVELMHSSGCQIKVEDCSSAIYLKFEDNPKKPDMIKLVLDDSYTYHSVPEGSSFIIEPSWDLPHIAVFYCSDNDTFEMRRTRTLARSFMSRHKVPAIVISHKQLFERSNPPVLTLDQHAIHMCLESRDKFGPLIVKRLPIDLASFINIDARQMNRNLAYLTGLHEPPKSKLSGPPSSVDVEKISYSLSDSVSFIRNRTAAEWRALFPVGLLLLSVLATVLTGYTSLRSEPKMAVSINGHMTSVVPATVVATTTPAASSSSSSHSTTVEVKTATKTITVTETKPSKLSVANSLSVLPPKDIGRIAEKLSTSAASETKTNLCSAEVFGDQEVLIRMPPAPMLSWLSKDMIAFKVTRNNVSVEIERFSSSAEGIILLLPRREAYGVLNISIVTTKKPKVNETFTVDFGSSLRVELQAVLGSAIGALRDELRAVETGLEKVAAAVYKGRNWEAISNPLTHTQYRKHVEKSKKIAAKKVAELQKKAVKLLAKTKVTSKALSAVLAMRSAVLAKEVNSHAEHAKKELMLANHRLQKDIHRLSKDIQHLRIRDSVEDALIRAQVQSKLYWMKLQGKVAEAKAYEKLAAQATRRRHDQAIKARRIADEEAKRNKKSLHKSEKRAGKKIGKKTGA